MSLHTPETEPLLASRHYRGFDKPDRVSTRTNKISPVAQWMSFIPVLTGSMDVKGPERTPEDPRRPPVFPSWGPSEPPRTPLFVGQNVVLLGSFHGS